jgi:histone-lysine N-methyltransferase SETD2
MPLLDINGVMATSNLFYRGFVFLYNKKQDSYNFALQNLLKVYQQLGLLSPITILTNKEAALINACEETFPIANVMICLWHVNINILSKARPCLQKNLLNHMDTALDPTDKAIIIAFYKEVHAR